MLFEIGLVVNNFLFFQFSSNFFFFSRQYCMRKLWYLGDIIYEYHSNGNVVIPLCGKEVLYCMLL